MSIELVFTQEQIPLKQWWMQNPLEDCWDWRTNVFIRPVDEWLQLASLVLFLLAFSSLRGIFNISAHIYFGHLLVLLWCDLVLDSGWVLLLWMPQECSLSGGKSIYVALCIIFCLPLTNQMRPLLWATAQVPISRLVAVVSSGGLYWL